MIFGVDYYPEHWPPARWSEDARLMRALGLQVVRIAEFAWSRLEPAEGQFTWGWLDQAIETLAGQGLKVILGTPTAAPPAWLSRSYPDTLPVDDQGRVREFGSRRHYCPNSPRYRQLSQAVVQAMAERYNRDPRVIGWQIDNEFGGGKTARCYCPNCAAAFRQWLQGRYGSLEALNEAWGAVFWSQEYAAWEQIQPPILTVAPPNPSHVLDYYRFSSDSFVSYQQLQIDILQPLTGERQPQGYQAEAHRSSDRRKGARQPEGQVVASPPAVRQFITHNFMGLYPDLDGFRLAANLDFATWDSYPTGNPDRWRPVLYPPGVDPAANDPLYAYDVGDPLVTGMAHDLTRGFKQKPFWIMEQQCGHINWGQYNIAIRPGTIRLWTWHALASGASAVVYFRWRACLYAQEQYHSGLLHHDASPDVGYRDVQAMQPERELMQTIVAQPLQPRVAMLFDFNDLWALQLQPHRKDFGYLRHLFAYYQALARLGLQVDLVDPDADLNPYKLILAPSSHLVTPVTAHALERVARKGATVVLGVRSGFKTPSNLVTDQPLPGALRYLAGGVVSDWHSLPPGVGYDVQSDIPGLSGKATVWAEALRPPLNSCGDEDEGAQVFQCLASYTSGPFAGRSAMSEHAFGAGCTIYVGWYPSVDQAQALLQHLAPGLKLPVVPNLPPGVLHFQRGPYRLLFNFTDTLQTFDLQGEQVEVAPRDVRVLHKD